MSNDTTYGDWAVHLQNSTVYGHIITGSNNKIYIYMGTQKPPMPLEEALAQLAAMPTAELSPVGHLAEESFMEYGRNPNFVGRAETMQGLAEQFKAGEIQVAAVTGYGGLGKSTLAVEFAHRYGRYFAGGVQWVSMAEPSTIPTNIARTGGSHLHPQWHEMKLPDQVALVRRSWESPLPRLLIFDNCEAADLLEQYRPKTGGARVLVTSRKGNWPASVPQFPLIELTVAESIRLLQGLAPHLDETGAEQVAQALGKFPLALHMAGSYLAFLHRNGRPLAPADYVAQLAAQPLAHRSLQELSPGAEPLSAAHVAHVGQTFAMSKEQLAMSNEGEGAWFLLAIIAQFAPSVSLPLGVLWEVVARLETNDITRAMWLELLLGVGLVEREEQGVRLHPLLGHFVRGEVAANEWAAMGEVAAESVSNQVHEINEAGYPAPLRPWTCHVRHMAEQAEERGSEWAGVMWNNLGYYYNIEADYARARSAFERTLAINEATFGGNHPNVARDVNNLGMVLKDLGDLANARAALERALTIWEASLGDDHPQVSLAINNFGLVLQDLGDLAGARAAFERALAIDEATFGHDHPNVSIKVNNLGGVLNSLGDLAGARAAFERALAIDEATFGRDHPNVATDVNNLGLVLYDLGDLVGVRAAFERALTIFEQFLPPDHPHISTVRDNLDSLGE